MSDAMTREEFEKDERHMTKEEAYRILVANEGWKRGWFFHVTFRKKDGELRTGTFTSKIPREFVKGTGRKGWKASDRTGIAREYDMLLAFDIQKKEPRFIKLNQVIRIARAKEALCA